MTLQQLEYIVAVDEYRHFVSAAESCNVTQSTLSLMIKKLEDELDVRIFDRNSHPVSPTETGRKVIDMAKVVIFNCKQIVEMTRSAKEQVSGSLRVAMISTVAPVLMPGLFKYTGERYPSISLSAQEMLSSTIKEKLRKAELDMGIVTSPVNDPDLLEIPLYHEKFMAYISPSYSAYGQEAVENSTLFDHPLWVMRNGVHLADRSKILEDEQFSYEKIYEGGRVGTLVQIVNENGGMTVIPETHIGLIMYSLHKNIRPIVDPEPGRVISIAVRRDFVHEKLLNVVIDAIKTKISPDLYEDMIKNGPLRLG